MIVSFGTRGFLYIRRELTKGQHSKLVALRAATATVSTWVVSAGYLLFSEAWTFCSRKRVFRFAHTRVYTLKHMDGRLHVWMFFTSTVSIRPGSFLPPSHLDDVELPPNHKCFFRHHCQKYHANRNCRKYRVARKKGYAHLAKGPFLKAHISMSSSSWMRRTQGVHHTSPHAERASINDIIGIIYMTAGNYKQMHTTQPFHLPSFTKHNDSLGGGYKTINECPSCPIGQEMHSNNFPRCHRPEIVELSVTIQIPTDSDRKKPWKVARNFYL